MQEGRTVDPRTKIQQVKRIWLREILLQEGEDCDPGAPAEKMRTRILSSDINYQKWLKDPDSLNAARKARLAKSREGDVVEDEAPNLGDLTRPQLMQLCKKLEIKTTPSDTKASLIEKLDGKNAA